MNKNSKRPDTHGTWPDRDGKRNNRDSKPLDRIDDLAADPFRYAKASEREAYDAARGRRTRALFQRSDEITGKRPPEPQAMDTAGLIGEVAEARIAAAEHAISMMKTIIGHQNRRIELLEAELKLMHREAGEPSQPGTVPNPEPPSGTVRRVRRQAPVRLRLRRGHRPVTRIFGGAMTHGHTGEHDDG